MIKSSTTKSKHSTWQIPATHKQSIKTTIIQISGSRSTERLGSNILGIECISVIALSIKTPTPTFLSTLDHEPCHMVLAAKTKGAKTN